VAKVLLVDIIRELDAEVSNWRGWLFRVPAATCAALAALMRRASWRLSSFRNPPCFWMSCSFGMLGRSEQGPARRLRVMDSMDEMDGMDELRSSFNAQRNAGSLDLCSAT
jgi:hypothetical protein